MITSALTPSAVLAACLLLATAYAYDFSDPYFNEHLQSAMEEIMEEEMLSIGRVQRDADQGQEVADEYFKCKHRNLKTCCGKINLMKNYGDKGKIYGKQCYEEVVSAFKSNSSSTADDDDSMMDMFSCEKVKMIKLKHICVHECIGKKTKILKEDGSLNAEEIKQYAREYMFNEEWSKELGEKALDKCLTQTYNSVTKMLDEYEIKCNPTSVQFHHCLWKEIEMTCPESKVDLKAKCVRLRERLRKQQAAGM
uniref:Odorant binding protein 8 n=1 Tax=Laodelphax striatellus TaxID=195883 RepID=A0A096W1J7_LAOST|nr:odorant binding protein 8 [Laodelphax striatellus]